MSRAVGIPNVRDGIYFLISVFSIFAFLTGCATKPLPQRVSQVGSDIYYGGVYRVAGNLKQAEVDFPGVSSVIQAPSNKTFRNLFKNSRNDFSGINLIGFDGELAPNDSTVMACGFTGEKFFSESILIGTTPVQNVRSYVGGALFLQNFQRQGDGQYDIKLLACYPFSMTTIGLVEKGQSSKEAGSTLVSNEISAGGGGRFGDVIKRISSKVAPVTGLGATVQVRDINVDEKSTDFIEKQFSGNASNFKHWLAGEIGAQLAVQIGMPIVPYTENTSSRQLAVMLENGSAYNIKLPSPDYIIDVDVEGFSKAKAKETASETLWVYGAYAKVSIKEAGTGIVRWEKSMKVGVPKKTAATQLVVDHSVAQFSALSTLLENIPVDLMADKKAKSLIQSCLK